MDNAAFPGNSHSGKKGEEKKIEKVVTGRVIQRDKPLGKRFLGMFIAEDARGVGNYILLDVIIPAFKDVISDIVSQGIERTLFGGSRNSGRRPSNRSGSSVGHISYNRYSSDPPWRRDRREEPSMSRRARATHDFREIILASRIEAHTVIDRLFDLINRYEQVTVADLYELVGITGSFTDEKWGWTDLRGAGVSRISGGYLLDLPAPEPLE